MIKQVYLEEMIKDGLVKAIYNSDGTTTYRLTEAGLKLSTKVSKMKSREGWLLFGKSFVLMD